MVNFLSISILLSLILYSGKQNMVVDYFPGTYQLQNIVPFLEKNG
jgi:hypothetical protein